MKLLCFVLILSSFSAFFASPAAWAAATTNINCTLTPISASNGTLNFSISGTFAPDAYFLVDIRRDTSTSVVKDVNQNSTTVSKTDASDGTVDGEIHYNIPIDQSQLQGVSLNNLLVYSYQETAGHNPNDSANIGIPCQGSTSDSSGDSAPVGGLFPGINDSTFWSASSSGTGATSDPCSQASNSSKCKNTQSCVKQNPHNIADQKTCEARYDCTVTSKNDPAAGYVFAPTFNNACVTLPQFIQTLLNYLLTFGALIAGGMFARGAFNILTSRGNPSAVADARSVLINAAVGLILVAVAFIVVRFLGGAFQAVDPGINFNTLPLSGL